MANVEDETSFEQSFNEARLILTNLPSWQVCSSVDNRVVTKLEKFAEEEKDNYYASFKNIPGNCLRRGSVVSEQNHSSSIISMLLNDINDKYMEHPQSYYKGSLHDKENGQFY